MIGWALTQEAELPYSYKDSVEHYKDFVLDS